MDRQRVAVNPPIALESHPLPSGPTPDLVRRRGLGYQPVPTDPSAEGAPSAAPRPNRAARRKATRPGRLRLAALLVAPASALLGASPSFASPGSSDPSPRASGGNGAVPAGPRLTPSSPHNPPARRRRGYRAHIGRARRQRPRDRRIQTRRLPKRTAQPPQPGRRRLRPRPRNRQGWPPAWWAGDF